MSDNVRCFPPDDVFLDTARSMLASRSWKIGERHVSEDVTLRVDGRSTCRRAADGCIIAYAATVQVDPQLGVPCGSPGAKPRWSSQSVLYVMLDENGDVPIQEQLPWDESEQTV